MRTLTQSDLRNQHIDVLNWYHHLDIIIIFNSNRGEMKVGLVRKINLLKDQALKSKNPAESIYKVFKRSHLQKQQYSIEGEEIKLNKPLRLSPIEQFVVYTKEVLPKIENSIEIDLLKNKLRSIPNQHVVDSIIESYLKRRVQVE